MSEVDKEIRILHLITRFSSGGAEKTVQRTISALNSDKREYKLFLATGAEYDSEELDAVESSGAETKVFRSMRHYNPLTAPIAVISVAWFLYSNEIDILHTHSTEAGIIGRIAAWIAGTNIVIHELHGDPIAEDRNSILNLIIILLEWSCAKITDTFVAKSENIRDSYLSKSIGSREKYHIIPHGIETNKFKKADKIRRFNDSVVLLYVGRVVKGKGIEDLLEAVDRIRRDDLCILIAGEGPDRDRLESIVQDRELSDFAEFLGYRDDVPELMTTADVLVLPSYREGTPRVITEALAAGTPVLSTRIAGIPDQVRDGETGVLINPGSVSEIERNIKHICENIDRWQEMGEVAEQDISRYQINKVQKSWTKLYDSIVNSL